jgi:hypothetical protein
MKKEIKFYPVEISGFVGGDTAFYPKKSVDWHLKYYEDMADDVARQMQYDAGAVTFSQIMKRVRRGLLLLASDKGHVGKWKKGKFYPIILPDKLKPKVLLIAKRIKEDYDI